MARLRSKVAIITRAASGICKEIAKRFASEDAKVVIADLQLAAAQAAADEINCAGGSAMAVAMDVSDESAVEAGVAAAFERFGSVDILVSNAGIQIVKPIDEFPFGEWKKMLAIHLDGAFLTTKACLRHMYKGKHGVRANVVCPGFVRTPLVEKQIPEQAKALGISEDEVVHNVMLKETVDGEFTTT